jgi:hypothetical protein
MGGELGLPYGRELIDRVGAPELLPVLDRGLDRIAGVLLEEPVEDQADRDRRRFL